MAEQLSILGLWERVVSEPEPPPPPVELPVRPPVDPRQEELLGGAHTIRSHLEEACSALDADAVRALYADVSRRYGSPVWAEHALAWADEIEWLLAPADSQELARRALVLGTTRELPGAPGYLVESVRAAALKRAAQRLIEAHGAAAQLEDGRPAGYLVFLTGDYKQARELLAAACEGQLDARWLGWLGEAAWRSDERFAAMRAYCLASLVDPAQIDQECVTCSPVLELLDLSDELELSDVPFTHLAVLADLSGKHALGEIQTSAASSAPVQLAAKLCAYRQARMNGALDETARIAAKRELARLAPPGLRELLRRLS